MTEIDKTISVYNEFVSDGDDRFDDTITEEVGLNLDGEIYYIEGVYAQSDGMIRNDNGTGTAQASSDYELEITYSTDSGSIKRNYSDDLLSLSESNESTTTDSTEVDENVGVYLSVNSVESVKLSVTIDVDDSGNGDEADISAFALANVRRVA